MTNEPKPHRRPSDPDPHLPEPRRVDPTRQPMVPPAEGPEPKVEPPGPTPTRPRRP